MATLYSKVIHETALRVNGIAGAQVASAETNYASTSSTTTELDNPRYPPAVIKDAVLDAEAMIALAIANTKDHIWRQYMFQVSTAANSGSIIPVVDALGTPYIGALDPPYVVSTKRRLEQAEYGDVRAYLNDPSYFVTSPHIYALRGEFLWHTQADGTVLVAGCSFSRAAQATSLAAAGNILFPDVAVPLYWAGAVSLLTRDGEYAAQSQQYRQYFENGLAAVTEGQSTFQQFIPEPPRVVKASV